MREWTAALDAICARINPVLVLAAIVIALLNLAVAAQRWTVVHPASSLPVKPAVATLSAERCSPILAPELRDLMGYD
jgi:hypothetical protein